MIFNLYKSKKMKDPKLLYNQLVKELTMETGIEKMRIQKIISEYKTICFPKVKKNTRVKIVQIDDVHKIAIRQKIHSFWHNHELPTFDKLLKAVNEDESLPMLKRKTMFLLLQELNFLCTKRNRNCILTEREDLILCRRKYLRSIKKFREEGRTLYYFGEILFSANDCSQIWTDQLKSETVAFQRELMTDASKEKCVIIVHVGSREGFVNGGLLLLESKTNTNDFHKGMNTDKFLEWFQGILPLLNDNAVIIMDNTSYNTSKTGQFPVKSWKKVNIIKWLHEKNIPVDDSYDKTELLELVKQSKPAYNKYTVDEIAETARKTVLRLPPYHSDLNLMELAWTMVKKYVKTKNTFFKPNDFKQLLKKGIVGVTMENWRNFEKHIIEKETKFWKFDHIVENFIDNYSVGTVDTSSSDSEL